MVYVVVLQQKPHDPEKYAEYVRQVVPTIMKFGGDVVAADNEPNVVEGNQVAQRTVILSFPSEERVFQWYHSPEYKAIMPLRLESIKSDIFIVHGLGDAASATIH
jgi:uncharacterized protein (DUF1330 family)